MAEKKSIIVKKKAKDEEDMKDTSSLTSTYVQGEEIMLDEDGVSEELPLLAGYEDRDGVRHMTFTCREMTGRDEEALAKNDLKSNGAKSETRLLELCVESIGTIQKSECKPKVWSEMLRNMYVGDRGYMTMKIREISLGTEIKAKHKCPNCGQKLDTILESSELEIIPFSGMKETSFELPRGYKDKKGEVHINGKMRLATGVDAEITIPTARKNISTALTLMLTRLCTFDDGTPITTDVMNSLTKRDRDYLMNLSMENTFGVNQKIEVTCDNCGDTFEGDMNTSNFF